MVESLPPLPEHPHQLDKTVSPPASTKTTATPSQIKKIKRWVKTGAKTLARVPAQLFGFSHTKEKVESSKKTEKVTKFSADRVEATAEKTSTVVKPASPPSSTAAASIKKAAMQDTQAPKHAEQTEPQESIDAVVSPAIGVEGLNAPPSKAAIDVPIEGKRFSDKFIARKELVASQEAERFDTVPFVIDSLTTKIDYLQNKLIALKEALPKLPADDRDQIESYKQQISALSAAIDTAQKLHNQYKASYALSPNSTWISTASPQTLFSNSKNPREAKQRYVPGLMNQRTQTVRDARNRVLSTVSRSAAMTDFSHGEISLQELQDYAPLINISSLPFEEQQRLIKRYGLNSNESASDDQELNLNEAKLKTLVHEIARKTQEGYQIQSLDAAQLAQIIQAREEILNLQFLQDLTAHLSHRPADGEQLIMGRSSLLDMKLSPRGKDGLVLSERTEAFDMKAIYDKMDNKTIFFDIEPLQPQDLKEKGYIEDAQGYIDEAGQIHLPKKFAQNPDTSMKLRTVFCNICAQGNIENSGEQKVINAEAIDKLRKLSTHLEDQTAINNMESCLKLLEVHSFWDKIQLTFNSPTPFNAALDFQLALDCLGGYGSINCYGGVDRTGYLVEAKTYHALEELLAAARKIDGKEDDAQRKKEDTELLHQWGLQLLGDHGVSLNITYDNKGHKAFKLREINLKLFATHTLEGTAKRIRHIARVALVSIPGVERQRIDRPDKYNYPKTSF
jgi:hypothetical protein